MSERKEEASQANLEITKAVEAIQNDPERERAYQEQGGTMEEFYQKMLAAGIARKEPYNVVSPGESTGVKVGFLIRS